MEKAKIAFEGKVSTLVEVTPTQLRDIANLLELSEAKVFKTETVVVDLTDKISFAYTPTPNAQRSTPRSNQ